MKEYVCRYLVRDSDHPLQEKVLFEHGTPVADAQAFAQASEAFAGLMKLHGTPEAAIAALMRYKRREELLLGR